MGQRSSHQTNNPSEPPTDLVALLAELAAHREQVLDKIKEAYDQGKKDEVFALVGKLFYEGPGA